jgi:sarcosine oxidase delta subunit
MRIRLNQEYRNKIANRMRVHLEQEDTQEKEKFFQLRENMKPLQNETWKLAKEIVSRHYTPSDIKMAYHLQNKFENVDTIAKDSCFHFGYMGEAEERDQHDKPFMAEKYIESHFDFKLNGNINGKENGKQNDFAYAMYRDELKGREGCNPDINIEQKDNQSNPHWTKVDDANEKYLGLNGGEDNQTSFSKEWNNDYVLDLIGREYCRDRSIKCEKAEFDTLMIWQQAKGQMIMAHEQWIESILNQMKEIKLGLKGYRYLDEGLELATELGLTINDAEIIRTNSTGLVIYNPKNLAERIKGMKNKSISREQKIALRKAYDTQQQAN